MAVAAAESIFDLACRLPVGPDLLDQAAHLREIARDYRAAASGVACCSLGRDWPNMPTAADLKALEVAFEAAAQALADKIAARRRAA